MDNVVTLFFMGTGHEVGKQFQNEETGESMTCAFMRWESFPKREQRQQIQDDSLGSRRRYLGQAPFRNGLHRWLSN